MENTMNNVKYAALGGVMLSLLGITTPTHAGYRPVPDGLSVCSVVQRTSDGFLAMRDGPGVGYPPLRQLYPGDVVFETEYAGNWVHINYTLRRGSVSGWVS